MSKEKLPSYGGQALIEGVLMRGSRYVAAAMRNPDGNIETSVEELKGIYQSRIKNIPFLRGLVLLWDALGLGMRFLVQSANIQSGEDEKIEGKDLYITIITSLLLVAGLFFVTPALFGYLSEHFLHLSSWFGNVIEGVVRLLIVVLYIWGVGRIPEIHRVFQYHGAEHKTINAFEAGADLTPKNVMRYSLEHPRCGTAFLLTLVIFSIILFSLIGPLPPLYRLATRVILIPLLAGVAYEYIRWTANHLNNPLVKIIVRPNLWLQKLTTVEPDEKIVEVAIAAFNKMIEHELAPVPVSQAVPGPAQTVPAVESD